jgi:hypothetical protein
MPHTDLWTYPANLQTTREALIGCDVEARDGSIGKVDVIPAGAVERIDVDDKNIFVALTKDQIKDSPEYDPAQFDEGYRTRLGTYYDPYLH